MTLTRDSRHVIRRYRPRHHPSVVSLALAIASSLLLGACGGGGGGGQISGYPSATTGTAVATAHPITSRSHVGNSVSHVYAPRSREEKDADRAAAGLYQALAVAKSGGSTAQGTGALCKLMSLQTQTRVIGGAKVAAGRESKWNCESAIRFLLERSKQDGSLTATNGERVVGVKIVGETATATVKTASGKTSRLVLVKEDGQWKLTSLG